MRRRMWSVLLAFVLLVSFAAWTQPWIGTARAGSTGSGSPTTVRDITVNAAVPWQGAPGGAVIDEQAVGIYDIDTGSISYNSSGSTTMIHARYNLNDTTGTGAPSWTTIELRYYDPSPNSEVRIYMTRNSVGGGVITTFASCTSTDASVYASRQCPLNEAINFTAGYIYTVTVRISRTSPDVSPRFLAVRLF